MVEGRASQTDPVMQFGPGGQYVNQPAATANNTYNNTYNTFNASTADDITQIQHSQFLLQREYTRTQPSQGQSVVIAEPPHAATGSSFKPGEGAQEAAPSASMPPFAATTSSSTSQQGVREEAQVPASSLSMPSPAETPVPRKAGRPRKAVTYVEGDFE